MCLLTGLFKAVWTFSTMLLNILPGSTHCLIPKLLPHFLVSVTAGPHFKVPKSVLVFYPCCNKTQKFNAYNTNVLLSYSSVGQKVNTGLTGPTQGRGRADSRRQSVSSLFPFRTPAFLGSWPSFSIFKATSSELNHFHASTFSCYFFCRPICHSLTTSRKGSLLSRTHMITSDPPGETKWLSSSQRSFSWIISSESFFAV